jgi:hypothetical protein
VGKAAEEDGAVLPPEPDVPLPVPDPDPELPFDPELLALPLSDEPLPHAVQKSARLNATVKRLMPASTCEVRPVEAVREAGGCGCMRVSPPRPNEASS